MGFEMSEWIELRAYLKFFWLLVQVRCGRKPENTRLNLSLAETNVLMRLAADQGWRAMLIKLQEAGNANRAAE